MAGDIADRVFFAFDQIDHRAGDRLLAFERGHPRPFAHGHSALIDLRHFRCLHRFIAALVIDHEQTFVADHFVFVEQFLGAGEVPLRIDVLDVDLALGCVLIFGQQTRNVGTDRRAR